MSVSLPAPRGEVSALLLEHLGPEVHELQPARPIEAADPLGDEDLQLALYLSYELHYRGLPGVAAEWEWEPTLLRQRRDLENAMEAELRARVERPPTAPRPEEIDVALREIADADDGPSLSRYIEREATTGEVREFMVHRSAYQLKEADPHSWALPRLSGPPKAARPISSRRPTLTPGRFPDSAARPRPLWSRSRPTSTAEGGPSASTPSSSPTPSRRWASTRRTAPTSTTSPP